MSRPDHSTIAAEEENISSYVDSCVNLESYFSIAPSAEVIKEMVDNLSSRPCGLVLGHKEDVLRVLKEKILTEEKYADDVKEFEESGAAGDSAVRVGPVLVGVVAAAASRHNCAARPDCISKIVKSIGGKAKLDPFPVLYVTPLSETITALAVANGVARGSVKGKFESKSGLAQKQYFKSGSDIKLAFVEDPLSAEERVVLTSTMHAINLVKRLVDTPTNLLDTVTFAEIASKWCAKWNGKDGREVHIDIVKGDELRQQGYGGLWGTGKAAQYPPHLVTLSYKPSAAVLPDSTKARKAAFVGKGIVYDSGGLSIKSGAGMCGMKHDMGGAAGVFGAFLALVESHTPALVSCVLCLADNAVGPKSQRNDDIILMKSGITVEVNNTDAEGRLVLSDGVYHASAELAYTPDLVVDMATLTGAQGIATGLNHAAIYSNTQAAEDAFQRSGRQSGDLCFPVLYCPEYHKKEFDSKVADYRNSVTNRGNAQVSCAAQFVGNNIPDSYKNHWVHVDMAYPVTADGIGTGFGVSLLVDVVTKKLNSL